MIYWQESASIRYCRDTLNFRIQSGGSHRRIRSYHFTQSDHEKTIKDVKKYIDIDEDFIDTEVYGGYSVSSPDPDKKGTLTLKDTIVDLGYTEDYDIEPHYNTDIYKKALDSILAEGSDDIYKSLEDHFNEFE